MKKEEKIASLRGRIVKKVMDIVVRRQFQTDGFLNQAKWLSERRSLWRPGKKFELEKYTYNDLPIEILKTKDGRNDKAIFQLHGGGYVVGLNDLYRITATKYAQISRGASVVSIDYRVGPEHQYPAALNDAEMAWDHLLEQGYLPENIIIVGDSAGGNLAASLTLKLRDQGKPLPAALVFMSPWLDLTASGDSYEYNREIDPIFGVKNTDDDLFDGKEVLLGYIGDADLLDPYLSPIYGDLTGFPPMLIQVGTEELIESDSITFYNQAIASHVDATLTKYNGMFHAFQIMLPILPESKVAWQEVEQFILKQFYD